MEEAGSLSDSNRPDWNQYFMNVAKVVVSRSVCLRHKIGTVIVNDDHQILSTGYNGPPRGVKHCKDRIGGCIRDRDDIPSGEMQEYCYGLHSEANAIAQAAREGIRLKDATLYCTYKPCSLCARLIVNVGITKIYYVEDYPDELTFRILEEGRVNIEKVG